MPLPKKGETKKQFILRAIKVFKQEGFSQKVAIGRAHGFWKTYKSKK